MGRRGDSFCPPLRTHAQHMLSNSNSERRLRCRHDAASDAHAHIHTEKGTGACLSVQLERIRQDLNSAFFADVHVLHTHKKERTVKKKITATTTTTTTATIAANKTPLCASLRSCSHLTKGLRCRGSPPQQGRRRGRQIEARSCSAHPSFAPSQSQRRCSSHSTGCHPATTCRESAAHSR